MTTDVDICNRALQMAAARSTITALNDGTNEANQCNLLYSSVRDQVLTMAFWNFARKLDNLKLVKAAPGSPESPVTNATQWTPSYPAPPWIYEYLYPNDCIQFRYLTAQPGALVSGVPIFSTPQFTYDPLLAGAPQKFIVANDNVGPYKFISNITRANPAVVTAAAHGFSNGDTVYITSVVGMTQINNLLYTVAGVTTDTFQLSGINSTAYNAYVSPGGVAVNQTATAAEQTVILTNAPTAIGCYTKQVVNLAWWPQQAQQALIAALAGFLAIPLSGDKNLAKMLVEQANSIILSARASDANEGLTIQDVVPDWIRVRSGSWWSGAEPGMLFTPYPPLFSVS